MVGFVKIAVILVLVAVGYMALVHFKAGCVFQRPEDLNVAGRTALITGANTGIGLVTAKEMAALGVNVILACRDVSRCQRAADEVKMFVKEKLGDVEEGKVGVFMEQLDLSSLENVRDCAKRVIKAYPKLHYLINNAGVNVYPDVQKTQDGHEMHFGVNHLGHFLLTERLLPHMKKTGGEVRVIILSSRIHEHFVERFNISDPGHIEGYHFLVGYGHSKLANILHARELARRENAHLDGRKAKPQVVAVSVHPGLVATELSRHTPFYLRKFMAIIRPFFMKTSWEGAQTSLHCALHPSVVDFNGAYYADCVPTVTTYGAQSNDDARNLWKLSEELVAPYMK